MVRFLLILELIPHVSMYTTATFVQVVYHKYCHFNICYHNFCPVKYVITIFDETNQITSLVFHSPYQLSSMLRVFYFTNFLFCFLRTYMYIKIISPVIKLHQKLSPLSCLLMLQIISLVRSSYATDFLHCFFIHQTLFLLSFFHTLHDSVLGLCILSIISLVTTNYLPCFIFSSVIIL